MESTNYPEELRGQDHDFIAKKLGVTVEDLEAIMELPPVNFTAYPNSDAL